MSQYPTDDSKRKAFKPPRRRRSRRSLRPRLFPDDQARAEWLQNATTGASRAVAGIGLAIVPLVADRFGDVALALMSLLLAAATGSLVFLIWWARHGGIRRDLAADVVSLAVLVPASAACLKLASADSRLGSQDSNYIASALGVVAIFLVVTCVATSDGLYPAGTATSGVLPAGLLLALVFGGSAGSLALDPWQAAAASWIIAAVVTIGTGLFSAGWCGFVAAFSYGVFVLLVLLVAGGGSNRQTVSSAHEELSIGVLLLVGVILFGIGWAGSRPGGSLVQHTQPPEYAAPGEERSRR